MQADLEELEHAKLVNANNPEAPPARNRAVATPAVPVVTPPPPSAPLTTIPDSAVATTGDIPREVLFLPLVKDRCDDRCSRHGCTSPFFFFPFLSRWLSVALMIIAHCLGLL